MRLAVGPILRAVFPRHRRRTGTGHPDRRRLARSVVVAGCSLITLALLGMGVTVETVKPEWRDPEYGHRLHQVCGLRAAHPDRPLVLAVGSSRTQMGISPAAMGIPDGPGMPVVYNFGQSGAGPLQNLLTVLRLLDAGVKPDFLLVELFPAALAADGPAEQQFARIIPRLSRADLRRLGPYSADPVALGSEWVSHRVNSWYAHRLELMSHWQPNWLPWQRRLAFQWEQMDPFGFTPYPYETMPPGEREKGIDRVRKQYAAGLANFQVGAMSDRAIHDLLTRCQAEGIPVAFYLMPEGPAFASWYPPGARAKIAAYRDALTRDRGVAVFDVSDGFPEEAFADGHHLLRDGAARFSRRLAASQILPWVRGAAE